MLPHRFGKDRRKDCNDTDEWGRQREHRQPFIAEEWCAFTAYRFWHKSPEWTKSSFEAIGKDIAEAANGDANAWARWAGGVGAGAKLSGWMLAVGGVLYVLSWLTGVGELATIAAFMGAMLASTIVLSTAESELRIKAASQAKTPEEFKEQVTKGATARTNVIVMVGLLALALAIRFVAKTYFPETVTRISKALARFREKVRIVGKLSEVKAEFTTEMESQRQKLVEAGETAKESSIKAEMQWMQ